jgi:hypothetical protein
MNLVGFYLIMCGLLYHNVFIARTPVRGSSVLFCTHPPLGGASGKVGMGAYSIGSEMPTAL